MLGDIIAIALGLLVGVSLGALGGGGSTLAVPILVFVAGFAARDATTASLLVVGLAAAFGVVGHFRNGNVRLGAGIAFGLAGIVGSRIGLLLNRSIDEQLLLLGFSVLILFVAARMWRSVEARSTDTADTLGDLPAVAPVGPVRPAFVDAGAVAVQQRTVTERAAFEFSAAALLKLAGAATVVGMLTGLFGVGGGFAVVPALTLLLKFPAREAIGTSLVVIAINAAVALGLRSGEIDFDWAVVLPFLATVTVGVLVGTSVAQKVDADRLTRSFAGLLAAVAVYTALSTVLA